MSRLRRQQSRQSRDIQSSPTQGAGLCVVCRKQTQFSCECEEAEYCSQEHQREDWRNHQSRCRVNLSRQRDKKNRNPKQQLPYNISPYTGRQPLSGGDQSQQSQDDELRLRKRDMKKKRDDGYTSSTSNASNYNNNRLQITPVRTNTDLLRKNSGTSDFQYRGGLSNNMQAPPLQSSQSPAALHNNMGAFRGSEVNTDQFPATSVVVPGSDKRLGSFSPYQAGTDDERGGGVGGTFLDNNTPSPNQSKGEPSPRGMNRNNISGGGGGSFFDMDERGTGRKGEDLQQMSLDKLFEERQSLRSKVIKLFGGYQYESALIPIKQLTEVSRLIANKKEKGEVKNQIFEYIADSLFIVKANLKLEKLKPAREHLIEVFEYMNQVLVEERFLLQPDSIKMIRTGEFTEDKSRIEMRDQLLSDVRKRCNLYSLVANQFYAVGDEKNCEKAYVKYVKIIETVFGGDALETSNCYFLVGVYYLENFYYLKALACFRRALSIRMTKLGEKHESTSDCWYNIAIIYKQTGKQIKAIEYLLQVIATRSELVGEQTLPVAQALETLGKVYMEEQDYRNALTKFQECYAIRKKIYGNNMQHPDVQRISLLIIHLFSMIKQQLFIAQEANSSNPTGISKQNLEVYYELNEMISTSVMDNNLNSYLQTDRDQLQKLSELHNVLGIQTQKQQAQNTADSKSFEKKGEGKPAAKGDGANNNQNTTNRTTTLVPIHIDSEVTEIITSDQLILLESLVNKIKFLNSQAEAVFQIKNSDFIKNISQNPLLFKLIKKKNPHIFATDADKEMNNTQLEHELYRMQRLEIRKNIGVSGNILVNDASGGGGGSGSGSNNMMMSRSNLLNEGGIMNTSSNLNPSVSPMHPSLSNPMLVNNSTMFMPNPYAPNPYAPNPYMGVMQMSGYPNPYMNPLDPYFQQQMFLQQQQMQQQQQQQMMMSMMNQQGGGMVPNPGYSMMGNQQFPMMMQPGMNPMSGTFGMQGGGGALNAPQGGQINMMNNPQMMNSSPFAPNNGFPQNYTLNNNNIGGSFAQPLQPPQHTPRDLSPGGGGGPGGNNSASGAFGGQPTNPYGPQNSYNNPSLSNQISNTNPYAPPNNLQPQPQPQLQPQPQPQPQPSPAFNQGITLNPNISPAPVNPLNKSSTDNLINRESPSQMDSKEESKSRINPPSIPPLSLNSNKNNVASPTPTPQPAVDKKPIGLSTVKRDQSGAGSNSSSTNLPQFPPPPPPPPPSGVGSKINSANENSGALSNRESRESNKDGSNTVKNMANSGVIKPMTGDPMSGPYYQRQKKRLEEGNK